MTWYQAALLMIGMAMFLMVLGLPVAFAFISTNLAGAFIFMGGERGLEQVVSNMTPAISSFILVPVPLFILMGDLMIQTGLARKVVDGFDVLIGRVPGRLCHVTVGAGTGFGALSGSALAGTAMLGATLGCAAIFLGVKAVEYSHKFHDGLLPGAHYQPAHKAWELEAYKEKVPAGDAPADDVWSKLVHAQLTLDDGSTTSLNEIELDLWFLILSIAGSETTTERPIRLCSPRAEKSRTPKCSRRRGRSRRGR